MRSSNTTKTIIAVAAVALVAVVVISIANAAGKAATSQLVCKNATGTLTITYDSEGITDYDVKGTGVKFNIAEANNAIKGDPNSKKKTAGMGVDAWIAQFESDFTNEQNGTCR